MNWKWLIKPVYLSSFSVVALALVMLSCGNDSVNDPILGEKIDSLLNTPIGRTEVREVLNDCMIEQGHAITDEQLNRGLNAIMGPPGPRLEQVDPYQIEVTADESGLVTQALNRISSGKAGDSINSQTDPLERFWSDPAKYSGKHYPGGCLEVGEQTILDLPAYKLQTQISEAYINEVGKRLFADKRILDINMEWSTCMASKGFEAYFEPGDHIMDIAERIDKAGQDVQKLREIREFDRSVTGSATECSAGLGTLRSEIREEYERQFFENHSLEVAELAKIYAAEP